MLKIKKTILFIRPVVCFFIEWYLLFSLFLFLSPIVYSHYQIHTTLFVLITKTISIAGWIPFFFILYNLTRNRTMKFYIFD